MRKLVWVGADWEGPWESKKPFLEAAISAGADAVLVRSEEAKRVLELGSIRVVSPSDEEGVSVVVFWVKSNAELGEARERSEKLRSAGKKIAVGVEVRDKPTEQLAVDAGRFADFLLVSAKDWKIIPLENLIAALQEGGGKIIAEVRGVQEALVAAQTLEVGTAGVLLDPRQGGPEVIKQTCEALDSLTREKLELFPVRVKAVSEAGLGDRACVDTTSLMRVGEGMLVGSQAEALFLVHSETLPSEFVEPRPFRVNAGGVHAYIQVPGGKTKYLSELKAGDEVLVVGADGSSRAATVGRVKIERRPMVLVEAEARGKEFKVLLQNAETINLVRKNGTPISVTKLQPGTEVLVYLQTGGRHFGMRVQESLVER